MTTYKIIRFRLDKRARAIKHGLSLEQAKEHCSAEDTHHFKKDGTLDWFDGFTEEDDGI